MIVASIFAPRLKEDRWGCDYDRLLMLLESSCRKFGLRHVVISDSPRPQPLVTKEYELPEKLMQLLLDGQRQLLAESDEEVLLVGADCLVGQDPRNLFLSDITITVDASFSDCYMNTGAIWCRNGKQCAPVWEAALAKKPVQWGQDQVALYTAILESDLEVVEISCNEHNRAPDYRLDPRISTVVHFRGRRKSFMEEWAKNYLGVEAV